MYQGAVKKAHKTYLIHSAVEFARAMEEIGERAIVIGSHRESGKEVRVRIPFEHLRGHHLIQGRSGSGKSRYVESLMLQLAQSFPEAGFVLADGKGESFARVHLWIAALLSKLTSKERERLLERVVIIDPFHPSIIPPLNFCVALPGYPAELLAEDILGGLRRLFAESQLTIRMEVVLRNTLIALIEAGKHGNTLSLLEAKDFLSDEDFRDRVLLHMQNEEVRAYFSHDFPHESRGTIEAVKSRLSYLLLSEDLRLGFGAESCTQFQEAFEKGKIVLVNLGKSRRATDTARDVVGTLLLSSLGRAVFSRAMNQGPCLFAFLDEFQNFILPGVFEKLYTEARAYRFFITAVCQQLGAQIASRSLKDIILNNVRYVTCFASNEEDARLLGRVTFRPTGCLPKPRSMFSEGERPHFYTESEELEVMIRRVPSLKPRSCYFWDKESLGAQRISTSTVPEPHEWAGMSEAAFLRFAEELDPLWKRMGTKRKEVMYGQEEGRKGKADLAGQNSQRAEGVWQAWLERSQGIHKCCYSCGGNLCGPEEYEEEVGTGGDLGRCENPCATADALAHRGQQKQPVYIYLMMTRKRSFIRGPRSDCSLSSHTLVLELAVARTSVLVWSAQVFLEEHTMPGLRIWHLHTRRLSLFGVRLRSCRLVFRSLSKL